MTARAREAETRPASQPPATAPTTRQLTRTTDWVIDQCGVPRDADAFTRAEHREQQWSTHEREHDAAHRLCDGTGSDRQRREGERHRRAGSDLAKATASGSSR